MKAKKENKTYRVTTEEEKKRYLKEGFDIYDDQGNLLEHSPLKKIEYSAYAKIKEELENLKAENEELKATVDQKDEAAVIEILSAYAEEHGIDLGRTTTVVGIVKKIRESNLKEGE